jgi:hypothetical protein
MTSSDAASRSRSHNEAFGGLRFSLRTLFVVIAGIGLLLGYWINLPRLLPEWNRLLNQVASAHENVAAKGMLHGKPAAFSDRQEPAFVDFVIGTMTLIAFYGAKILISRRVHHWAIQIVAYAMVVSLILPYIYLCWEDWGNPFIFIVGNWFGDSVAVLFVPTVTFLIDLLSRSIRSTRWVLARSALEIVVGIPIWGVFWAYFSFWVLRFGWI